MAIETGKVRREFAQNQRAPMAAESPSRQSVGVEVGMGLSKQIGSGVNARDGTSPDMALRCG
ncbi:hypothetical protein PABG_11123 [Paracoccidioides brasiliensis Pb03]|uniref:Uncharacterized protein n=2 Tax=Paracoccidioides brasiliensis TaxID=121759 RepID=C1G6P9_PARBD|nr:uncharacterized protein PADG_02854 [Paracoccidioides brasiliensis Pb18]EEH46756.1 hypothetical protein PADG_02854 [Paracoccidioides brasiliensis Pb18]KGY15881.1 hypothetical protein PABG_11123 [Paracoccidioides brasiliensis Pb03]ODH34609.1 hypothetical protein ACO22_03069 [Paracoccidioides brasiliensis]ODH47678.1 hypothetical protein GX48_06229 [Paracoccidioides brasiliensis]